MPSAIPARRRRDRPPSPLPVCSDDAAARLRELLRGAGYSPEGIEAAAGADLTPLGHRAVPVMARRTSGGGRLATLIRLFAAGIPVTRDDAAAALAPEPVPAWAAAGLLEIDADSVTATVQLGCHGDLVVAADWGPRRAGVGTPPDHVMGFSPSTLTLSRLTVRRPGRTALDLGTGCGLQALLATEHVEDVVASDRNPRALAMTRFNAALNRLGDRVRCLEGNLFEPAADTRFDLVVSNPPFVLAPDARHLFMSAGMPVDGICRAIAEQAPAHLEAQGWCQFLANWAVVRGQDWRERLASWFAAGACDVWVIRRERQPADEYAALWVETEGDGDAELGRRFDTWMRHLDAHDVEAVDYGLVTMRPRLGATARLRIEDVRGGWEMATGAEVAAAFDRHDWLDATDDAALLDACLEVAGPARLTRELVAVRGEWVPVAARLHVEAGIGDPGGVDPQGAVLVAQCDGTTPLRTLVEALAARLGTDATSITADALVAVRRLVERGVLLPPAGAVARS